MIDLFWQQLKYITRMSAKSPCYKGTVEVVQNQNSTVFSEKGEGPSGSFWNYWQFQKQGKGILLAKKRPIQKEWVPLLLFLPSQEKLCPSACYLCQKDCYYANIFLQESGFTISWTIHGPKKEQKLLYHYYAT